MDLETENRLAALLMDEARRLRAEADKEGVLAYLRKPTVRGRPNARFLTATVLGVQQANKVVEVDELWRAREKELELENRLIRRSNYGTNDIDVKQPDSRSYSSRHGQVRSASLPSSSKRGHANLDSHVDGELGDEEVEKFLNSRIKRGRGAVGSRMDEPGPYPAHTCSDGDGETSDIRTREEWEQRVLGPEKPSSLVSHSVMYPSLAKTKTSSSSRSKKHHHKDEKHRKEKGSERSKRRKEKRSKHR